MLAISTLSANATAFLLVIGFLFLVLAAFIAFAETGIKSGAAWLCSGLALIFLVSAWNAVAAT